MFLSLLISSAATGITVVGSCFGKQLATGTGAIATTQKIQGYKEGENALTPRYLPKGTCIDMEANVPPEKSAGKTAAFLASAFPEELGRFVGNTYNFTESEGKNLDNLASIATQAVTSVSALEGQFMTQEDLDGIQQQLQERVASVRMFLESFPSSRTKKHENNRRR